MFCWLQVFQALTLSPSCLSHREGHLQISSTSARFLSRVRQAGEPGSLAYLEGGRVERAREWSSGLVTITVPLSKGPSVASPLPDQA